MKLCLLSGWANPPEALQPLADLLDRDVETRVRNAHDLVLPTDAARELADEIGDATVLAGWSLGGMIALSTAARMPDRVVALVLVGTPARFCSAANYRHGFPLEQLTRLAAQLRAEAETALTGFFLLSATPQTLSHDDLEVRIGRAMRIGTASLLEGLAFLEHADLRPEIAKLACPALVMHGRQDTIVPWRAGKIIADQVPGSQWELVPDAGHDLPLQSPEQVADRILEFIRSLEA